MQDTNTEQIVRSESRSPGISRKAITGEWTTAAYRARTQWVLGRFTNCQMGDGGSHD